MTTPAKRAPKPPVLRKRLKLKGRWLLFNWGRFRGEFYGRHSALAEIRDALGDEDFPRWREYFDLVKGTITVTTDKPFRVSAREAKRFDRNEGAK